LPAVTIRTSTLEAMLDHLAGVGVFGDEDFAEDGLDEHLAVLVRKAPEIRQEARGPDVLHPS
jgi:hypothetical protein